MTIGQRRPEEARDASIGIVTFAQNHPDHARAGSTRIRVRWPLKYWPEAEEFQIGRRYDTIVFQKVYWLEYARRFRGLKILDLCDPDFLGHGWDCRRMIDRCDGITCATASLAEHIARLTRTPVWVIPDRIDLETIGPRTKVHAGPATTAAWFGYSTNFPMLDTIVAALPRHGLSHLVVIADAHQPYQLPAALRGRLTVTNRAWHEHTVHRDLLQADLVLNPRSVEGKWRFKSLNKTMLAWALGLPVAHDEDELAELKTADARRCVAERRRAEVCSAAWDVRASVDEYRHVIACLRQRSTSEALR